MRRRRAGRKADGSGVHRLAHDRLHRCDLGIGRRASRRVFAHDEGAHAAVTDVGGHVQRAASAAKLRKILREGFEVPGDTPAQYVERHALDLGEVAHRQVAMVRLARRDGKAAVADHRGGDAVRG